jgi:hypothetical protein
MRLDRPFLKLPIRFDADALAREVRALPETAWVPHATGFPGNEAVRLVTVGGEPTDDFNGQMAATEHLLASPYVMAIMAELDGVWGRSRLMGLGPGAEVPFHVDSHYYWRTHWRIHIPIITNPDVHFRCGTETVHMAAGECWMFDSFRWHQVKNNSPNQRIHLVLDTVGSRRVWDLMARARQGDAEADTFAAGTSPVRPLKFEKMNAPKVMSPWEIRQHVAFLAANAPPHPLLEPVLRRLDLFADDWTVAWAQYGTEDSGRPTYLALLDEVKADLTEIGGGRLVLNNQLHLYLALENLVFLNVIENLEAEALAATVPAAERLAS